MSASVRTDFGIGLAYAGDQSFTTYDQARAPGTYRGLIIGLHGDHLGAFMYAPFTHGAEFDHVKALAQMGFAFVGIDAAGTSNWGGPLAEAATVATKSWAYSKFGVSEHAVMGGSMGGGGALNHIKRDASCKGAMLFSPAVDYKCCYGTVGAAVYAGTAPATGTFAPELNTVFGSSNSATFLTDAAGYLIVDEPASFADVPLYVVGTRDDTALPYGMFETFAANVNGVGGHVTYDERPTGGHMPFGSVSTAITAAFYNGLGW